MRTPYEEHILERGGEQSPRLRFYSHQDALDFANHCVEKSNRWLYSHSFNFAERYINGDLDIVIRVSFSGALGVCDFVLSGVPSEWNKVANRTGNILRVDEDGTSTGRNGNDYGVLVNIGNCVDGPEKEFRPFFCGGISAGIRKPDF